MKYVLIGILFLLALLVIVAVATLNMNLGTKSNDSSNISLLNIEAFAGNDYEYSNGYRKFTGSEGGAYDCCQSWRNGDASSDCH